MSLLLQDILPIGTSILVEIDLLRDSTAAAGVYISSATVAALILDSEGATVSGSSVSLSFVTGTNGKYQGTIPSTIVLVDGSKYTLQVTVTSGSLVRVRRNAMFAKYDPFAGP